MDTNTSKTFGQIIKEARETECLTQKELANQLDVSASYVSHLENDSYGSPPSIRFLRRLESLLDIPPDVLVNKSGRAIIQVSREIKKVCEREPRIIPILRRMYHDPTFTEELITHIFKGYNLP